MLPKSRLVATPIVDRTGKATTVYRRLAVPEGPGKGALAAAAPTVRQGNQQAAGPADDRALTFAVLSEPRSRMLLHEHRIAEGLPLDDLPSEVKMTYRDAYLYLSLGLDTTDAVLLHAIDADPERWVADPGAAALGKRRLNLAQAGGANGEGVAEAVQFLRQAGIEPADIDKMTNNGFSDSHVRGVLDAEQLRTIFKRMRYERSTVPGKQARAAHMIDLLIDGTLPFELVERGYRKYTLVDIAHDLVPVKGRRAIPRSGAPWISNADAAEILADPSSTVAIAEVMDHHGQGKGVSTAEAWHAIRSFGRDDALAYNPNVTLQRTSSGALVGPEGYRRVRDFAQDHLGLGSGRRPNSGETYCQWTGGGRVYVTPAGGATPVSYEAAELIEAFSCGVSDGEMAALIESGLNGRQLIAVATGESSAPIADGFL